MGFDYYLKQTPAGAPPASDYDAWEEWNAQTHFYLRRNMSGASLLAEAVITMGMGFDAFDYGVALGPFPRSEDHGAEFEAVLDAYLRWHGPEIPGIPVHKLYYSNDGWWVTREECRAALGLYARALAEGREQPEAFREDFIPFLQAAAAGDGFTAY